MDRERFKSQNIVHNSPDRPTITTEEITGGLLVGREDRLTVDFTPPLTEPRVVRGHTIGGGMSREALRRARKHLRR